MAPGTEGRAKRPAFRRIRLGSAPGVQGAETGDFFRSCVLGRPSQSMSCVTHLKIKFPRSGLWASGPSSGQSTVAIYFIKATKPGILKGKLKFWDRRVGKGAHPRTEAHPYSLHMLPISGSVKPQVYLALNRCLDIQQNCLLPLLIPHSSLLLPMKPIKTPMLEVFFFFNQVIRIIEKSSSMMKDFGLNTLKCALLCSVFSFLERRKCPFYCPWLGPFPEPLLF